MSIAPAAAAQTNGNISSVSTVLPTESLEKQLEAAAKENGVPPTPSPASQAPKIDALVHSASVEESMVEINGAAESNSPRLGSMSPGGTTKQGEGPADIPSQKLAFGEDKRALKALDKVFI